MKIPRRRGDGSSAYIPCQEVSFVTHYFPTNFLICQHFSFSLFDVCVCGGGGGGGVGGFFVDLC